jgi:hypothetical protein
MAMKYGFGTTIPMDFEHAIDVVTEALITSAWQAGGAVRRSG